MDFDVANDTNCKLLNLYGTTETTIVSSYKIIFEDKLSSIGKPIKNESFFVLT